MGTAAYNRGSRVIRDQADRDCSRVVARNERSARSDERARWISRIAGLERELARARRSVAVLRAMLTDERQRRKYDEEHWRLAVRLAWESGHAHAVRGWGARLAACSAGGSPDGR